MWYCVYIIHHTLKDVILCEYYTSHPEGCDTVCILYITPSRMWYCVYIIHHIPIHQEYSQPWRTSYCMHSSLTTLVHLGCRQCVRCISWTVSTCEVQLRQSPSSKTCSCFRSLKKWYSLSRSAHSEVKDCNMGSKLCPMRWQQTPKAQTFLKQVNMETVSCAPPPPREKGKKRKRKKEEARKEKSM